MTDATPSMAGDEPVRDVTGELAEPVATPPITDAEVQARLRADADRRRRERAAALPPSESPEDLHAAADLAAKRRAAADLDAADEKRKRAPSVAAARRVAAMATVVNALDKLETDDERERVLLASSIVLGLGKVDVGVVRGPGS